MSEVVPESVELAALVGASEVVAVPPCVPLSVWLFDEASDPVVAAVVGVVTGLPAAVAEASADSPPEAEPLPPCLGPKGES